MSRPPTSQPEKHGAGHHAAAPQVAVRDGNRLLCPCCGQTLMVLKEKRFTPPKRHHLQGDPRRTWPALEKLIAQQEAYLDKQTQEADEPDPKWVEYNTIRPFYRADSLVVPIDEKVAAHQFPAFDPPPCDSARQPNEVKLPEARLPEVKLQPQPPRDWNTQYEAHQRRRSERPLEDPFTEEGARLFAWAYYRLQRLAVQIEKEIAQKQAEIARLQAELSGGQHETTEQPSTEKPMNSNKQSEEKNNIVPRQSRPLPVSRRHAYADEGMAPQKVLENSDHRPP